jgi:hypothetical protein
MSRPDTIMHEKILCELARLSRERGNHTDAHAYDSLADALLLSMSDPQVRRTQVEPGAVVRSSQTPRDGN